MPFLLKHHFDPDWDFSRLRPEKQADGSVNHHELHYVNNVSKGDVIAEWVCLDAADVSDARFVFDVMDFPAGRGTGIRSTCADKLFAAVDGYVCYKEGKIVVRETLTIHSDVDYHTGNVNFIGKIVVEGSIRTGFSARAVSMSIEGQIEGAQVEAVRTIHCMGGVKGGKAAQLEAGRDLKLAYCEYATLVAHNDILIKGAAMHSTIYAGKRLAVGDRLTGGNICVYEYVYVGSQLGGGLDTDTSLVLGYKPSLLHADERYNQRIKILHDEIASFEKVLNKGDEFRAEFEPLLESALRELDLLKALKVKLWEGIYATERLEKCKILVPGIVKPGVEISIGSAFLKVQDFLEDVYFYYDNDEVKIGASTNRVKR
ncbi:DUF342 domain-containing protein [Pseudodesulfovibrio sp. JC047]|uniref:FapA family protein n=1 Tax=Pseudodesulfovibrio sp. JC047 TaxID=2683199 RepID=UPI0013D78EDC|nr:FapA family protein [Pseudodesulfovibrio sp. JC047]NDV19096.1 DUF342 domain-containing protein [Pseudodesulfovibrio sp. JC047]